MVEGQLGVSGQRQRRDFPRYLLDTGAAELSSVGSLAGNYFNATICPRSFLRGPTYDRRGIFRETAKGREGPRANALLAQDSFLYTYLRTFRCLSVLPSQLFFTSLFLWLCIFIFLLIYCYTALLAAGPLFCPR
jgi:hypothetical protein